MRRYVLSPRARIDLIAIWDYTAQRWSTDQAEFYIRLIDTGIETVAAEPSLGTPCDHIRKGYRKYPVGSHVLFYRVVGNKIDVVRVLHERMDFERHLRS